MIQNGAYVQTNLVVDYLKNVDEEEEENAKGIEED